MVALSFLTATLVAMAASYRKDRARTVTALRLSARALLALLPSLVAMTGLVGLLMAFTPPTLLARLFQVHGVVGFALISVVGALLTMPAPVAFPLAGSLRQLGAGVPALAAFITTLTMVGIVTAPLESEYFGRRFTVLRQTLSFLLALLIGLLMGELLR